MSWSNEDDYPGLPHHTPAQRAAEAMREAAALRIRLETALPIMRRYGVDPAFCDDLATYLALPLPDDAPLTREADAFHTGYLAGRKAMRAAGIEEAALEAARKALVDADALDHLSHFGVEKYAEIAVRAYLAAIPLPDDAPGKVSTTLGHYSCQP